MKIVYLVIEGERVVSEENKAVFVFIPFMVNKDAFTDMTLLSDLLGAYVRYGGVKFINAKQETQNQLMKVCTHLLNYSSEEKDQELKVND